MTECEVCGAGIVGKAQYVQIGSSKLRVCKTCARYGSVVVEDARAPAQAHAQTQARTPPGIGHAQLAAQARRKLYEQMDREIEEGLEIDEDYGRKIREARERAGLKQAELAQKINEKQSLLRKIEHEEILPTDEVRVKIERVLNITL
ncbi:MAG TPA: multiprotein bridging factor aMBF1 [Desulfobacteria bacterium]|nr:multiprotein bridging factor aMBF1 [Desulfobacteria bacterium]